MTRTCDRCGKRAVIRLLNPALRGYHPLDLCKEHYDEMHPDYLKKFVVEWMSRGLLQ